MTLSVFSFQSYKSVISIKGRADVVEILIPAALCCIVQTCFLHPKLLGALDKPTGGFGLCNRKKLCAIRLKTRHASKEKNCYQFDKV